MLRLLVTEIENSTLKKGHYKSINIGLLWLYVTMMLEKNTIDLFTCEGVI